MNELHTSNKVFFTTADSRAHKLNGLIWWSCALLQHHSRRGRTDWCAGFPRYLLEHIFPTLGFKFVTNTCRRFCWTFIPQMLLDLAHILKFPVLLRNNVAFPERQVLRRCFELMNLNSVSYRCFYAISAILWANVTLYKVRPFWLHKEMSVDILH